MTQLPEDDRQTVTRRGVIKAAGAGLATTGLAITGPIGSASAGVPTPALHTEGRWIKDPSGNTVRPRGFATASVDYVARSWYSYPLVPSQGSGLSILEWATSDQHGWYPNHVRLPVTSEVFTADQFSLDGIIQDHLRPAVDYLKVRGQYALIDFHLIRPYNDQGYADDDSEYEYRAGELMELFWPAVAEEFADDDNVIFELFNEPTLPAGWGTDDATIWEMWRTAAQPWVDTVQEHAPARPLVIGSPSWTSYPHMAVDDPFDGDNLIYAGHIYPANGDPYEENSDGSGPFDQTYGAPAEDVPVWITEFGWDPNGGSVDQGTTSDWGEPFREWIESYENVGWSAWCFDDTWAPTFFESSGQGHSGDWTLKDGSDQHAGFIKSWLADTRDEQNPEPAVADDQAPPAPTGLSVDRVSEISATVSWNSVTDEGEAGLLKYQLFLDGTRTTEVGADTTTATVDGLDPASTYEVSVIAVDAARNASPEATTTVETLARDEGQSAFVDQTVPCRIHLETFDEGGPGVAYFDTDAANQGGSTYRDAGVDISESADNRYIANLNAGEWMEYTVSVPEAGSYPVRVSFAGTASPAATVRVEGDGESVSGSGWQTGGWESWADTRIGDISLSSGEHVIRVVVEESGSNLDWVQIGDPESTTPPEPPETTPEEPGWPAGASDPDGDGLYEDLSGDGTVNFPDVNTLFQNTDTANVQNNTQFYDFDGDGGVDMQDVLALFEMV
ncbi:cellulase family glycosylhydrolase [Halococcoides cellulosivorans]|uniref:Uncharacterized protein n=1 Tax=Halococcoides cellulosivorans TaxID=1679096 RepID=A0A2R4X0X5_9EURY|nr:cellulase family glycosylhydrolase [Halococcoides cellulosivorans]AWB27449.1 hypothetical protein HARCEL1_06885 [Halococcoides cellulosivorans]